jgi:DNA-binding CsgD family transcriptional regulator
MIFITDPETSTAPDILYLQQQFKLTPAEAALTRELIKGDGVNGAAERIGTARAQLRSVLAKTLTGRQAELVRLVLSSDNRLR